MNSNRLSAVLGGVLVVLVVVSVSVFTVDQRENAIIFQLGEVKEVIKEPGRLSRTSEPTIRVFSRLTRPTRSGSLHRKRKTCWLILSSNGASRM